MKNIFREKLSTKKSEISRFSSKSQWWNLRFSSKLFFMENIFQKKKRFRENSYYSANSESSTSNLDRKWKNLQFHLTSRVFGVRISYWGFGMLRVYFLWKINIFWKNFFFSYRKKNLKLFFLRKILEISENRHQGYSG